LLSLGEHSLWVDELFSIRYARLSPWALLADVAANDNHPPLYYLLLHVWVLLFGESEFAVRSLSVIFGVLTVAVVYRFGTALYDERTGVLAAFVLAIASFSIYWSQEARMYSLLPLLAAVSVYHLWRLMHGAGGGHVVGYLVATAALLYTQSYGLFIVAAQNSYLLMLWLLGAHRELKLRPKRWIGLQLGVALLFLPWLIVLISRVSQLQTEGFWIERPTFLTLVGTISEFSGSNPVLRIGFALLVTVSVVSALLLIARTRGAEERRNALRSTEFRATTLLVWCLLTPLLLPFAISQFATPIYLTRPAGVAYFAFALLVARGITSINPPMLSIASLTTVALLSLSVLAVNGYVHRDRPKYRELVDYVRANVSEHALIVTCDDGQMSYPFAHYAAAVGLQNRVVEMNDAQIANGTRRLARTQPELWLITFNQRPEAKKACAKLPELLRGNYREMRVLDIPLAEFGVRIYSEHNS
jgi:uncharacterized membrane protein